MRFFFTAVAVGLAATFAAAGTAGEGAPLGQLSRVDPRVLADTADGKTASFLVVLKEQADVSNVADTVSDRQALGHVVVDRLRAAARSQAPLRAELARRGVKYRPFWIVNVIAVTGDRALVDALAERSDVARIEPDRKFRGIESESATASPAGPSAIEPGVQHINANDMWDLGFKGLHMVYANADTGVRWDHNALKNQYRGWNGATADHNYNWHDAIHSGGGTCGANTVAPCDDDGHGTHTMGTAVGGEGVNQIGVAPDAEWIACRNMDQGVGTPSTYIECLEFFIAPTNLANSAPDPNRRPHAIGNSYSCPPEEGCTAASLQMAVDNVRASGIFFAASAGNDGPACGTVMNPPGIYDSAISVGAVSAPSDAIASFSSRGPVVVDASNRMKPDVVAPGVNVRSSVPDSVTAYANLSGTSMAAPHVGGAVLLLWNAAPSLVRNVDQAETLLKQSAVHLTTATPCGVEAPNATPNNTFGFGRIDVLAAYNAAGVPTSVTTASGGNIVVGEGTKRSITANVTIRISAPRAGGFVVAYRTVGGTAKARKDYLPVSGILRFPGGQSMQRVPIRILRDAVREPNETFFLVLAKPIGGTIATPRVRVTIRNDDH